MRAVNTAAAVVATFARLCAGDGFVVDRAQSVIKDAVGRQRFWHGINFVQKSPPYYPLIQDSDIATLKAMGHHAVRLGVMMPGMYPDGPTLNTTYLDKIEEIVSQLYLHNISTIIDLHQDVLAPKICGEGTPDWMLNVSGLEAMQLPRPATAQPVEIDSKTGHPKSCAPIGPLKSIGWSMWYMTDQCGKAFEQVYDNVGVMAAAFEQYWKDVAARFRGHSGILGYELLNEPWLGDHVHDPLLLLEAGRAEKKGVGRYMQRMHDAVRSVDPTTLVFYAPAEVNNRVMRRVGYESGFLPGAGMAYHVYCITGTDGSGPTTPVLKDICHYNDKFSVKQRESDLHRLNTAGFVTEFGAVDASTTGLAEVAFVLDHLDAMKPPSNWAFWDFGEVNRQNATGKAAYMKLLGRPYARAVDGELLSQRFDTSSDTFEMVFKTSGTLPTEVSVSTSAYPKGFQFSINPPNAVKVDKVEFGLSLIAQAAGQNVTLTIKPTTIEIQV